MKILVFEDWPSNQAGGQELSLFETCTELWKAGIELHLAYAKEGNLLADYRKIVASDRLIASRVIRLKRMFHLVFDLVKALISIRKISPDLLYVNSYFDVPFPALLSKITHIPMVVHLRLSAPHYLSRQYRWGLNQASRLIAISEYAASSYEKRGIRVACSTIYNRADFKRFPSRIGERNESTESLRVIYVGRYAREKGVEVLIEAFNKVVSKLPKASLEMYGSVRGSQIREKYIDHLKSLVATGVKGNVKILGHDEEIRFNIWKYDILVLPSIDDFEAFGRVLIEAMANAIVPIGSRIGGIPEVFGDQFEHLTFEPNNASVLSSKILELADWRKKQPDLGFKLRQYADENFSINGYAQSLISVFERAIA